MCDDVKEMLDYFYTRARVWLETTHAHALLSYLFFRERDWNEIIFRVVKNVRAIPSTARDFFVLGYVFFFFFFEKSIGEKKIRIFIARRYRCAGTEQKR